jgi:enamine deaminase RidA (YjgF/YER057c/UK114 family)
VSDLALLDLARAILVRNQPKTWDSTWDSRGTAAKKVSQATHRPGTDKTKRNQSDDPAVPLSHTLGRGTVGQCENPGTALGTPVGQQCARAHQHYSRVLASLRSECPALIESEAWQQAVADAEAFIARWGEQADALGWTARDLFGLHPVPERPAASFQRLGRYDHTGLIWLLHGRPIVALTVETAAIQTSSGGILTYRKNNKPAIGPFGDSLDDMGPAV